MNRIPVVLLLLLFLATGRAFAAIAPQITVPRCPVAPVIDGTIGDEEWKHAAAVTGFVEYTKRHLDVRQIVAFVTRDDQNLYLAFKLPVYPAGASLIANYDKRDGTWMAHNENEWSADDILELFLDPHFGEYKAEDKFYQFMGNSRDFILLDQASAPAIGIMEQTAWNGRWSFKNRVRENIWEAEISIPLADLGVKEIPDGTKWFAHFSRIWGATFAWTTLSPVTSALNVPKGGARLEFDAQAPAVRLLDVTPLLNGRFGFNGEIVNGTRDVALNIIARVTPEGGTNPLAEKNWSVKLKPGEIYRLSADEPAGLADTNTFAFWVTDTTSGKTLAKNEFSFLKAPVYPVFPQKIKHAFQADARYLPSSRRVWVDGINFTQFPDRKRVADTRLSIVRLTAEKTGSKRQTVFSRSLPVGGGKLTDFNVPVGGAIAAEGRYEIVVTLRDRAGNELAAERTPFLWRQFPFVGTTAGMHTPIIPPYQPIEYGADRIKVLGREYLLNDLALFTQMTAAQQEPTVGAAVEPLLAAPVSLALTAGGVESLLQPGGRVRLVDHAPGKATYRATGVFPGVTVEVTNAIEYDGMAWLTLRIVPRRPVRVDGLVFDIPLREGQATLLHEIPDEIRRVYAGVTPAGTGTVWDSTRIANTSLHGNFKPLFWLGNEDRGLTWFGETDRGWSLDEKKPAIEVIRRPGEVVLRLNLINQPLLLQSPRTISFGLQATPVKPLPAGRRSWIFPYRNGGQEPLALKNLKHFTFDFLYMTATEFSPYPGNWDTMRAIIDEYARQGWTLFSYRECGGIIDPKITPEHEVYFGEWNKVRGHGAASYRDFRVWAQDQVFKRCGLHAFYEDNAYVTPRYDPALGIGYLRDDGQPQGEFLFRPLRELLRRDAALYAENKMPNYTAVHKSTSMMTPCYSFTTFAIDGEQRFMDTAGRDYIDNFPLDYIRAHIMGRQFGLMPLFLSEIHLDDALQQAAIYRGARSELALLLLHEIPIWPPYGMDVGSLRNTYQFMDELDIGAPDVVFHPYWENNLPAQTAQDDVKVSLWVRQDKAVAVIVNLGDEKEARVKIDFSRLGFTPTVCKNYENKSPLDIGDGRITIRIPRHDYRLIWMER